MIKRFFTVVLGTIAGIWISIILLIITAIIFLTIISSGLSGVKEPADNSILYIDLSGAIQERYQPGEFINMVLDSPERRVALDEIIRSLSLAAKDDRIKGVYLNLGGSSLGVASREEIVTALQDFKKSGKFVYAYGDEISQGDYYVASAADKIYLNPVGSVDVKGLTVTTTFFKNLLDKVGVEMQVVKVGSFKSAVEPFIRTEMSDSSRLQTEVFSKDIWGTMSKSMAENRGVSEDNVNEWADSMMMTWSPEKVVEAKAVTELKYRNQFEDMLRSKVKVDKKEDLPLITPTEYLAYLNSDVEAEAKDKHIAVLYAVGDIVDNGSGGIVATEIVPQILELSKDDKVAGLILRVNSGGGSAFASEQIWAALEDFKKTGKPFYVSMGDYAASGGYYISCGADCIYADATTLTGSIGIFGLFPSIQDLANNKLGINVDFVNTNANSSFPQIWQPMTEEQKEAMQRYIDRGYDTFTGRVAEGRKMDINEVKRIGEGRVWSGNMALDLGLVDKLGGLESALVDMSKKLKIDKNQYVEYPRIEQSLVDVILDNTLKKVKFEGLDEITSNELEDYISIMRMIKNVTPMQARMERIIIQ